MGILGIGVDLVHIPRIAALISRRTEAKFAAKILSQVEYAQWNALRRAALSSHSAAAVVEGGRGGGDGSQMRHGNRDSGGAHATRVEADAARVRFLAVRCSPPAYTHIPSPPHTHCLMIIDCNIFSSAGVSNQNRWSVKEAAYKAMYPYARATWKELSYTGLTATSKPRVEYSPTSTSPARKGNKIGKLHVSVSHDGEYVYTSVLAESPS